MSRGRLEFFSADPRPEDLAPGQFLNGAEAWSAYRRGDEHDLQYGGDVDDLAHQLTRSLADPKRHRNAGERDGGQVQQVLGLAEREPLAHVVGELAWRVDDARRAVPPDLLGVERRHPVAAPAVEVGRNSFT